MRSDVPTVTTRPSHELGRRLGDMTKRIGTLERLAGHAGTGTPGPAGPQGEPGPAGPEGPEGATGPAGESALRTFADLADLLATWPDAAVGCQALLLDRQVPMLKVALGWTPTIYGSEIAFTTNGTGGGTVTFPVRFLSKPMVMVVDADAGSASNKNVGLVLAQLTTTGFGIASHDQNGGVWASKAIRIGYQAVMRL